MAKTVVFKPSNIGKDDIYQSSQTTSYSRDQTTGNILNTSGQTVRTVIEEMFAGKYSRIITSNYSNNDAYQTIYTVPAGKVCLLTGLTAQLSCKALSFAKLANLRVAGNDLMTFFGCDSAIAYAVSFPLNALIVLTAGELVEIHGSTNFMTAMCGIIGYEMPISAIKII